MGVDGFLNLLLLYARPEVPVFVLGMWVSIFSNPIDPELKGNRALQIGSAIVAVPLSMVAIMAFHAAAMILCQLLTLLAVLLGFPYRYEVIEEVLRSRLAGPVSGWAAALFPWVMVVYWHLKGSSEAD